MTARPDRFELQRAWFAFSAIAYKPLFVLYLWWRLPFQSAVLSLIVRNRVRGIVVPLAPATQPKVAHAAPKARQHITRTITIRVAGRLQKNLQAWLHTGVQRIAPLRAQGPGCSDR